MNNLLSFTLGALCLFGTRLPPGAGAPIPPLSPPAVRLAGTLTGFAYGSFPVAVAGRRGSVYTDRFVLYIRPGVGKDETEVDCLHARWRLNHDSVPISGALDALRQLDDGHHIILAVATGFLEKSHLTARTVTLRRGRLRRPVEPIYNRAPLQK